MMALSLLIGFQQAIIVMHFKLNQETIEQKFCINKNKPELQCHGICHLKKQLQGTEKSDSASISIYQRVDMLSISVMEFKANNSVIGIRANTSIYKEARYMEPYREVFVPPPIA